jgi:hypothetical protein
MIIQAAGGIMDGIDWILTITTAAAIVTAGWIIAVFTLAL